MGDDGTVLDELAANATVAPVTRLVDGWLAKAAPDLPFRRCNAVLPPPGAGPDRARVLDAVAVLEGWYAELGQRLIVQVSSATAEAAALDRILARRGYAVEAPVDLLVADLRRAGRAERPATGTTVGVQAGVDAAWAQRYAEAHGGDAVARGRTEAYGRMLADLGPGALAAAASVGGSPAGVGFGVLERGWVGIFGMGTAPGSRRRGVGSAVLAALCGAAAARGARRAYLQVETDNGPAQALYRGAGFARSHGYHYRVSAPA